MIRKYLPPGNYCEHKTYIEGCSRKDKQWHGLDICNLNSKVCRFLNDLDCKKDYPFVNNLRLLTDVEISTLFVQQRKG